MRYVDIPIYYLREFLEMLDNDISPELAKEVIKIKMEVNKNEQ